MGGILLTLALAFACHGAQEPLFEGLGSYTRTITTSSPEAQRYFNQGLAFLQGFNHGAAIRSFQQAAELDPECAMAHWAIALDAALSYLRDARFISEWQDRTAHGRFDCRLRLPDPG
jgi:tetratricopeptide (TPR) repeat protein